MKLLVTGSRNIDARIAFWEFISCTTWTGRGVLNLVVNGHVVTNIITRDHTHGADAVPGMLNSLIGYGGIPITALSPNWERDGRDAEKIKTKEMCECADMAIVMQEEHEPSDLVIHEMGQLGKFFRKITTKG